MTHTSEPIILTPEVLAFYQPDAVRLTVEYVRARVTQGGYRGDCGTVSDNGTVDGRPSYRLLTDSGVILYLPGEALEPERAPELVAA